MFPKTSLCFGHTLAKLTRNRLEARIVKRARFQLKEPPPAFGHPLGEGDKWVFMNFSAEGDKWAFGCLLGEGDDCGNFITRAKLRINPKHVRSFPLIERVAIAHYRFIPLVEGVAEGRGRLLRH
jgi:hypothetical protein